MLGLHWSIDALFKHTLGTAVAPYGQRSGRNLLQVGPLLASRRSCSVLRPRHGAILSMAPPNLRTRILALQLMGHPFLRYTRCGLELQRRMRVQPSQPFNTEKLNKHTDTW